MKPENYFDHAATTPVDPRVLAAMLPYFTESFGNANSLHQLGSDARRAVDHARNQIAQAIGAEDPSQIIFTSGATEGNNWVISQFERVAYSPFEHSSVREPARHRGGTVLPNDGFSVHDDQAPDCDLLAVVGVASETGAAFRVKPTQTPVLRDVTQLLGHLPPSPSLPSYMTWSAHKLYGPKGVGALYAEEPTMLEPMFRGGGHEFSLRSGTLNVPSIVGLGMATQLAIQEQPERLAHTSRLRDILLDELRANPEVRAVLPPASSPHITLLILPRLQGETAVIELDRRGFAVSAGPACSSNATMPSTALLALGLCEQEARSALRVSTGKVNTPNSVADLARAILAILRETS